MRVAWPGSHPAAEPGAGPSGGGAGRGQRAQARSAEVDLGTWKEEGPRGGAWGGDMIGGCGWGRQGASGPGSAEGQGWARVSRKGSVGVAKLQSRHCGGGAWRRRGLSGAGPGGGGAGGSPRQPPRACGPQTLQTAVAEPCSWTRVSSGGDDVLLTFLSFWELAPSALCTGEGPCGQTGALPQGSRTSGSGADPHNSSVCPPLPRPRPGAVSSDLDIHTLMGVGGGRQ